MKKKFFSFLGLFFAIGMLFFTFFTLAWFSDKGLQAGFEIPIGKGKGPLSTAADMVWMAAPFCAVIAIFLSLFFRSRFTMRLATVLFVACPFLYTLLQGVLFLQGKDLHFTVLITLFFLLATAILAVFASFSSDIQRIAPGLVLCHPAIEISLLALSFLFREKYSQFYFGQEIYMGHHASFFYSYLVLSVLFYYLFYSLSLSSFLASSSSPARYAGEENAPKEPPKPEPDQESSESEEDSLAGLSLEDFGIER